MFKKPKRNFRGRRNDSEEQHNSVMEVDENGGDRGNEISPANCQVFGTNSVASNSTEKSNKKKKKKSDKGMGKKTSSVLSFEADEGKWVKMSYRD